MLHVLAIYLTALALGPGLAHLLELPNKIGLPAEAYLQAQQLYRGWALLGALVVPQVALCGVLAWMLRGHRRFALLLPGFLCTLGSQVVFWIWTFPANLATEQWTTLPADWETLRLQWEYSHAAGAVLNMAALAFLTLAAFVRGR